MYRTITIALLLGTMFATGIIGGCAGEDAPKEIIYVGTFDEQGLYVYEFNRGTDQLTEIQNVEKEAPDFQALHPEGPYLYSVSNRVFSENNDHGTVTAYQIDKQTGKLTLINEQSVEGRGPAHVSIDPKGRFAYVSNYSGGNLSVFRIGPDGSLSEAVDVVQHEGSSVNSNRQNSPHVHSIIPSADGRFIYASDLGMDRIMIYKVDQTTGELTSAEKPFAENTPGAGPRHFVIHPNKKFAYSVEELSSTVTVFTRNQSTGALDQIQRVPMLPNDFDDTSWAADIHISPDGKFLYASNRGHNSLVIFEINKSNGQLDLVGHEFTQGAYPRNFMIDSKGEYLLVANQDSNNVVVFKRNKDTGMLTYTGEKEEVPTPVCVTQKFLN